ncbi:rRNA maturation RNase YbeY [Robertmurraya andreesenii]|uniref:Endoribonuclease YbeY n=1 Tax=Anoxybacillus andreesenii TaxID=1325932 RepID=A0ABT9V5W3_9BACL|nr:rRNA maturation RNase YbeY [Robertmurraya andreesenii]MDQ0156340.1 putative rRNA maturation factor [Robertmurraya andreesenii]
MSLNIDFLDETDEISEEMVQKLEELLNFAAEKENVESDSELSVTFVSNERIQEINRGYRGKDYPTDVISFALEEMGEGEIAVSGMDLPRILGDIIISVKKAREQASEYGHSFDREMGFLAVHGLLHLLGYDHMNEEEEKIMFDRQREILDEFGLQR